MAYAEGTSVTPERSQAEISGALRRYGASGFVYGWEDAQAMVMFRSHERQIRFLLPIPDASDRQFRLTPTGRVRDDKSIAAAHEAEIRRRWRALALAIKAKLEAVESGITTFEDEFMAHTVLPDGRTVAEHIQPKIEQAYKEGGMPPSLFPADFAQRPALPVGGSA